MILFLSLSYMKFIHHNRIILRKDALATINNEYPTHDGARDAVGQQHSGTAEVCRPEQEVAQAISGACTATQGCSWFCRPPQIMDDDDASASALGGHDTLAVGGVARCQLVPSAT